MNRTPRALVSVSDKTGLVDFARRLVALGFEILSTGGTARVLREAGLAVRDVADYTGFPEMLDGRVKTLHPKIHGGLLYLRDNPEHVAATSRHEISSIDLVVVNLYPFRETISREGVRPEEAIEQIDIGGPSMVRSAAKNHRWVTVVCQPRFYDEVAEALQKGKGQTDRQLRRRLAAEAFAHTAEYDRAIADYLGGGGDEPSAHAGDELPERLDLALPLGLRLRYGENPHQAAAFYGDLDATFEKLHGKELSYNNLLDLSAAVELVEEFPADELAAVAIIKHTNPCGVAIAETVPQAWQRALETDRQSANGGIVAVNRSIDRAAAESMHELFTEIIAAPDFTSEALDVLRKKKNRRLLRLRRRLGDDPSLRLRSVAGGVLAQQPDRLAIDPGELRVVTRREPTDADWQALRFGWRVVKHVKSNAIVFTSSQMSLGIGAGQMSRVDAARVAIDKASRAGLDLRGAAVASDAFFPFADGLRVCAEAGATSFIQPGGSVRDEEVIAAANDLDVAMVFTGRRHFRH